MLIVIAGVCLVFSCIYSAKKVIFREDSCWSYELIDYCGKRMNLFLDFFYGEDSGGIMDIIRQQTPAMVYLEKNMPESVLNSTLNSTGIISYQPEPDIDMAENASHENNEIIKKTENVENSKPEDYVEIENEKNINEAIPENDENDLTEKVLKENALLKEESSVTQSFVPAKKRAALYNREQLLQKGFIKETFYSEDATTYIDSDRLEYRKLMGYDAGIRSDASKPQILIYHTHSREGYADSDSGNRDTMIYGVGERLSKILREEYGYNVLHHEGAYDIDGREYAYANAMDGIEKVLEENPQIEVIIDLHRDESPDNVRLVTNIQGMQMAKFMFFNGLSYTRENGEITSLPNPYIDENLAFSFQMQLAAEEYYPGLTRRIYLKGYRYNMHYRPRSLLIELGTQTNTLEEALNSCEPIAHLLDMVLKGKNRDMD